MTRLNPALLASLLLHLAFVYAANGLLRLEAGRDQASSGIVVAYLDLGADVVGKGAGAARRQVVPRGSRATGDDKAAIAPASTPGRATGGHPPHTVAELFAGGYPGAAGSGGAGQCRERGR